MTLPNHIQPLPHQQGHGALITALGSSLEWYSYFSSLEAGAMRAVLSTGHTLLLLLFLIDFTKQSGQNSSGFNAVSNRFLVRHMSL